MVMATDELTERYVGAMRFHRTHGRPEIAQRIQAHYDQGEELPSEMAHYLETDDSQFGKMAPPKPPPPRTGQGATKAAWQTWMLENSTVDPEVIGRAKKVDLILMAEANGLIEQVREDQAEEDEE